MRILIQKTNFRKGSEEVSKSGEGWRRECVWDVGREGDSRSFLSFSLSDYSLLNETAQYNCPEFMGLTIREDSFWSPQGKKLPGGPIFTINCYYRCGSSSLAMREFLRQEIQVGFPDGVLRRQPRPYANKGSRLLPELVFSAGQFRRIQ